MSAKTPETPEPQEPSTEFFIEGEGDRYLHASILMDEDLDAEAVADAKADAETEKTGNPGLSDEDENDVSDLDEIEALLDETDKQ